MNVLIREIGTEFEGSRLVKAAAADCTSPRRDREFAFAKRRKAVKT